MTQVSDGKGRGHGAGGEGVCVHTLASCCPPLLPLLPTPASLRLAAMGTAAGAGQTAS